LALPRLDGPAVAELLAVALFLPDDHDRLVHGLLAHAPGDGGPRDDDARIDAPLVLAAYLGVVVVDVLQDVLEADALGMADDAHAIHGAKLLVQLALEQRKKLFQPGRLDREFAHSIAGRVGQKLLQPVPQKRNRGVLARSEDVPDVGEAA